MFDNNFSSNEPERGRTNAVERPTYSLKKSLMQSEDIGRKEEMYLSRLKEENQLYSETIKKLKKKIKRKKQKNDYLERQVSILQDDVFNLETEIEKLKEKLKEEQRKVKKYKLSMSKNKKEKKRYKEKYRAERYANGKNPYTNNNQRCIPMDNNYWSKMIYSDICMLKKMIEKKDKRIDYIDADYKEV